MSGFVVAPSAISHMDGLRAASAWLNCRANSNSDWYLRKFKIVSVSQYDERPTEPIKVHSRALPPGVCSTACLWPFTLACDVKLTLKYKIEV
jgi:hypothetical protein